MALTIGRHTYGKPTVQSWLPTENVIVGSFCSIAEHVRVVVGGNHRADLASTFPFEQIMLRRGVRDRVYKTTRDTVIGNDVWIGSLSTILGGARIGHGCIIAANSVVFGQRFPPYAVIGGNPAGVLWYRFDTVTIERLLRIRWWDWSDQLIADRLEWFYKPAASFAEAFDPISPCRPFDEPTRST